MTTASFTSGPSAARTDAELIGSNKRFYDALWSEAKLFAPERFNTWPLVSELAAETSRRNSFPFAIREPSPPMLSAIARLGLGESFSGLMKG